MVLCLIVCVILGLICVVIFAASIQLDRKRAVWDEYFHPPDREDDERENN